LHCETFGREDYKLQWTNPEALLRARRRAKTYNTDLGVFTMPRPNSSGRTPRTYYTDVSVSAAAFLGFTIGFNPGEVIDFILGWTTIDIYGDDLEAKKKEDIEPRPDGDGLKPAP
jgi:hypothetical protein